MLLAFLSDNILCHSSERDEGFAAFPRAFRLKQPCFFYFIIYFFTPLALSGFKIEPNRSVTTRIYSLFLPYAFLKAVKEP